MARLLRLLQVVLHAVDTLVANSSNSVLRNGFEKVWKQAASVSRVHSLTLIPPCCLLPRFHGSCAQPPAIFYPCTAGVNTFPSSMATCTPTFITAVPTHCFHTPRQKTHGMRGSSSSSHTGLYHAQLVAQGAGGNAAALLSSEWCQLLSRIGDELMLSLVLYGSVFVPLPGGNMLQVTGRPVSMVSHVACVRGNVCRPCCAGSSALMTTAMLYLLCHLMVRGCALPMYFLFCCIVV
jgi:hypothetical protein